MWPCSTGAATAVLPTTHGLPMPPAGAYIAALPLDANGDGYVDLLMVTTAPFVSLWLNDGSGTLVNVSSTALATVPQSAVVGGVVADVDADGDVDVVLVGGGGVGAPNRLLINDGNGVFVDDAARRGVAGAGEVGVSATVGDVNGDGAVDVVVCTRTVNYALVNNGSGFFTLAPALLPAAMTVGSLVGPGAVALADVDFDGDVDVLGSGNGTAMLYLSGGNGTTAWQNGTALLGNVTAVRGLGTAVLMDGTCGLSGVFLNRVVDVNNCG